MRDGMNESEPLYVVLYVVMSIVGIILSLLILYVLFRLLEIYMPRIIAFFKRTMPKLQQEFDELIDNIMDLVPGSADRERREVKQEIHHHYVPQYDHSHNPRNVSQTTNITNTQSIRDSVYYSKGEGAGGGGTGKAGVPGMGQQPTVGTCRNCSTQLQAGWSVCPVCTHPIGSSEMSEHY